MARKFRRSRRGYRRRRSYRRTRRSTARKAIGMVRSLSRKVAAEVKKADNVALVLPSNFQVVLGDTGDNFGSLVTLRDYGYLYNVFGNGDVQGIQLDDFIGEQVRAKYLYIGLHLQQPANTTPTNPVTMRIMVIQDRNFEGTPLTAITMFRAMFGVTTNYILSSTETYAVAADCTLLPINPQQPGRFKVIRDFQMNTAPGWRQDYYKKLYIRQSELLSKGRIYYGVNQDTPAGLARPPGDATNTKSVSRNALYVFALFQDPNDVSTELVTPRFFLSLQTRFAYYDN